MLCYTFLKSSCVVLEMSEWYWKMLKEEERIEEGRKELEREIAKTRREGWFFVKSKIIEIKERENYYCAKGAELETPYIQVARILPRTLGGKDALNYLADALCFASPKIGKWYHEGMGRLSLAMECGKKSQPPIVSCSAANFLKLYPQFVAAPSAPYKGRIWVLKFKAENERARQAFETAYWRLTGQLPAYFLEHNHNPFEGLISSYQDSELVVAFHAANKKAA